MGLWAVLLLSLTLNPELIYYNVQKVEVRRQCGTHWLPGSHILVFRGFQDPIFWYSGINLIG
jgi:hypothetical protein